MSESEPKPPAFSVTASETSPVARSLAVEVEAGEVSKAFERAYKAVGRSARIKGFRPGKAPRRLVEARLGCLASLRRLTTPIFPKGDDLPPLSHACPRSPFTCSLSPGIVTPIGVFQKELTRWLRATGPGDRRRSPLA